jgi:tetrahydromethanopterin S-methyltransferase subunit D
MTIVELATNLIYGGMESFHNTNDPQKKSISKEFVSVFVFVIVFILIAFFGQKIWNQFLAGASGGQGYITVLKPLPSLWHAIAIYVTLGLFFGK